MDHTRTEDIARKLGISRATVSRALNNRGRVSEKTRNKVLAAANELNFSPNKAARALAMNKKFKIAVIVFSEPKYYWNQVQLGVNRAYEELRYLGLEVEFFVTDINKPEEQIILMEKLVNTGFDAIAVAPNDSQIMDDVIDRISNDGYPVLVFNADVPTSKRLCYVGCNYIKAGRLAGELMGKISNGFGKVAVLTFSTNIITIQQRIIGFRETIAQFPRIEVMGPYKLKRTGEDAYDFTRELISRNPEITGIFVSFGILDEVAKALVDAGKQGQIKVVGYDLSETIRDYLLKDVIHTVITHEPFAQGYFAVKILYRYLSENIKPDKTIINTKLEAIFKENLDCHMDEMDYFEMINN